MSAVLSSAPASTPWRRALPALALVLVAIGLLYRETFAAMVGIWSRSDTFAHAFLVPPISLWLIWRQRAALAALTPRPQPWLLLPMAAAALAWLVGDSAGVNALTQLSATALLVLAAPAVLGGAVGRQLMFPLGFLFFMVPFGEFLMPTLMDWTADVTVFALKLFGLPVYREGLQFVIPSGTWSVVEACSGVRYLIASFMVGMLFAYLNYRSTRRRLAFAAVALLVPVLANWARAVLIVMLGHLSNNRLAAGVDHIIYGWVFFGLVVMLMFFIGSRWSEAPAESPAAAPASAATAAADHPALPWLVAGAAVVLIALPHGAAWRWQTASAPTPVLALPALEGVAAATSQEPLHAPIFEGAQAEASRVYGDGPQAITVHVAYYRQQTYGHKLVNSENVLARSEGSRWRITASGEREITVGQRRLRLRTAQLRAGSVSAVQPELRLQVRQIYWVDGDLTTSDAKAAALSVLGRLTGRGDDAAAITFYIAGDEAAGAALDEFIARHLDALATWLAEVRAAR